MRIEQPVVTGSTPVAADDDAGQTTLSCEWSVAGRRQSVFYRTAAPLAGVGAEPFVCVSLIPAMKTGEDVDVLSPTSPRLLGALPAIQRTFSGWFPALRPVRFQGPERPVTTTTTKTPTPGRARGVGCFFSGGVDSYYSVLRHFDEIDTLIFAHGFDIPLANVDLRRRVSRSLRESAAALGKTLVEVETNVREVLDPFGDWGKHTHGTALASVAHLLANVVGKVYIPSSYTREELAPWGSHPEVDPFWGTECVEVVHDVDDDASRFRKTATIAGSDAALAHLRVCWENRDNAYNCGRCEKCLRTMLMLRLAGGLGRCPTFAVPLDLSSVTRLDLTNPCRRTYYMQILAAARDAGDAEMVNAVERALQPRRKQGWLRRKMGKLKHALFPR